MKHVISSVDLNLVAGEWPFAVARREEIERHWADAVARNPALWNGRILIARNPSITECILHAEMLETDFASFLAWRDWDFPDTSAYNIFGSALVLSRQGAVILGRMAEHTASPGVVDMPGGSLDLSDLRENGVVDLFGSAARELEEETGLLMEEGQEGDSFGVFDGQLISVNRVVRYELNTEALVARIKERLAGRPDCEFDEIIAVTEIAALDVMRVKSYALQSVAQILGAEAK